MKKNTKKNIRYNCYLKTNLMMGESYRKSSFGDKDFVVTGEFHNEPSGLEVIILCVDNKTKKCFVMNKEQNRFGWIDSVDIERVILK
jgi:hypothetical protein